jgi:hypothetical protein
MGRNNEDFQGGLEGLPSHRTANQLFGAVALEDHEDLMGRFDFAKGDDRKLLNYKYKNAVNNGLKDDILKNGVHTPLEIHVDKYGDHTLTEGHHRLAVMLKHRPDTPMPVHYWRG